MDDAYILNKAKKFYDSVKDLPYPPGFSVSPWWGERVGKMGEDIQKFETSLQAVHAAQANDYAFDHRRPYIDKLVDYKLECLRKDFGHLPYIRESRYSIPETQFYGYSNILLFHLNAFLRSTKHCAQPARILEIGTGYGALARIFKILRPDARYVLLDLPESLFFAMIFLAMNFPPENLKHIDAFGFVPVQKMDCLFGEKFDLVINTGSLQEMPEETVRLFMDFIENKIKAEYFYSCNYAPGEKQVAPEAGNNNPLPIDVKKWKVLYEQHNPPIIRADSDRNWVETVLRRR